MQIGKQYRKGRAGSKPGRNWGIIATTFAAVFMLATEVSANETKAEKQKIESIVREYLLNNPEILLEMSRRLEAKQRSIQEQQFQAKLTSIRDELFNDPNAPFLGNAKGKVVVVEFSDYNCPYCKRMAPLIKRAIKENPELKIVLREFPILGDGSVYAASAALAAARQGKYAPVHFALIAHKGRLDKKSVDRILSKLGLDMKKLAADMKSSEVTERVKKNLGFAQLLGINGTPAFIAGKKLFPGALSGPQFQAMIKDASK